MENAPARDTWNWTSMILIPDFVTGKMLEDIKPALIEKRGEAVERVSLERLHEGLSAQILHVGPFSDEPRSQNVLHGFIEQQGYRTRGRHHEIYMSDPRRSPPERWKTILRYPIEKV